MSDDYEVVGMILKKKSTGGGCLGALILIAIIGACVESCVGGKKNNGNVADSVYTGSTPAAVQTAPSSPRDASPSRLLQNTAPTHAVERRIRCKKCSGNGIKTVPMTCPTCKGRRKVVDQARTAQSAMQGMANGLARGRHTRSSRPRTFYMPCPACNGKGRIFHQETCNQCGGKGSLPGGR